MAVEIKETIANVNERPHVSIKSDKFNHEFVVRTMPGGFVFYGVTVTKGAVPKELQGRYTSMKSAVKAVVAYEARADKSQTVQRDEKAEIRNATKVQRERTEHIRTGSDNGEG